ncbi:glycosyltransferase family 39 protein [Phycicoccus duodecadis]|uniref:Dolichyl-phosphate-mannose-protein mannosyltransferase n=1 Tax=Phycicoccus duodecadis TaxID=173053 RepID=A0A2N3YJW9_9MICO|nr:glycosyltransferase family 39 protein [Phycicoccus duodecadis]PKW27172.1 dolichyl-phosphate-mannose-protein mannosyltransferase [Phycicoccus duodecadis]
MTVPARPRRFVRAVADHWVLSLGVAALTVVLLRFRSEVDVDVWLHLRIGRELRGGQWFGVLPDPLVALADRAYLPTQWLSEVVGSWAVDGAGLVGLRVLRLLALLVMMAALYATARRTMTPARSAGVVLVVAVTTAAAWAERPQVAGLALAAVTVLLWERTLADGRPRWLLVPLTWVWAMVHGTWAVGLAFGALTLVVAAVTRRSSTRWPPVGAVLLACVVVAGATPLGPRLLIEPFAVSSSARAGTGVNEWQTPTLGNPLYVLVLVVGAVVVVRSLRRRPFDAAPVLFALAGAGLAAYSVRTVAFGGLLLVPALMRAFPSGDRRPWTRGESAPLVVAALVMALAPGVVWGGPSAGPLGRPVDTALAALPAGTVAAVDVRVSGWVLAAHPGVRPLRDLRAEVYTAPTAAAYEDFTNARPGWAAYADAHRVAVIVAAVGEPLDRALAGSAGWRVAGADGTYRLWRRA